MVFNGFRRFTPTGIVHYQVNGQHRGPFKIGGLEKAPKNADNPFEALQCGAFKTKALKDQAPKSRGIGASASSCSFYVSFRAHRRILDRYYSYIL